MPETSACTPDSSGKKKPRAKKKGTYRSWVTTDHDEVELRRKRAAEEPMRAVRLSNAPHPFVEYEVARTNQEHPRRYVVELRSLTELANTCTCPDFAKNGLGTCKHVEYVLRQIPASRRKRADSPYVEVYLRREPEFVAAVQRPSGSELPANRFVAAYLSAAGELKSPWETTLLVLLRDVEQASDEVRASVRVSREIRKEANRIRRRRRLDTARKEMEARLRDPETAPAIVRHRLYDYQQQGMLHLAFTGRAMLTDEMGLGKTVQAIAACKLLRDLEGVRRVLVVCPASLKTEWDEQIRKFTNLPVRLVYGLKPHRDRIYEQTDAFFVVTNYEQILRDLDAVNNILAPDVVILDEAQRIKNWQTKTAQAIKRLAAPYAFVLTGTPLENRIDEIYSLTEFVDPRIFGSLFRFNRDFYTFDDRGRASGLKNMRELNRRLRLVMLRRRKDQIADQLPERVDNNYFVTMTAAQRQRYAEYEQPVATLVNIAKTRPLTREEMDRLQRLLACMRMICDSLYVLDRETKVAPKIDELLAVLEDVWEAEPMRKVLVFSEWERMLYLLAQALENEGVEYAWHTGSVPQQKRRGEIDRFKKEPACRLFLSTDSGATGLNLQAASMVVNLDLPWNPAKLEQRIARAWRQHQTNSVQVVNMVTEDSIEHRMLSTLAAKRELADGVLDARGHLEDLQLPTARATFLHRLEQVVDSALAKPVVGPTPEAPVEVPELPSPPSERFQEDLTVKLGDRLLSCRADIGEDRTVRAAFVVVEADSAVARRDVERIWREAHGDDLPDTIHVLDRREAELLARLAETGAITVNDRDFDVVYEADSAGPEREDDSARRRKLAAPLLTQAQRKFEMASLLTQGGFGDEALPPLRQAMDLAGRTLAILCVTALPKEPPETYTESLHAAVVAHRPVADRLVEALVAEPDGDYLGTVEAVIEATQNTLTRTALS